MEDNHTDTSIDLRTGRLMDPREVTCAYRRATGSFWLTHADGSETRVDKERWIGEFRRLYPQRRLPWERTTLPTHGITE